jgi:hypothetical protein
MNFLDQTLPSSQLGDQTLQLGDQTLQSIS